jgi:hypothetical protein
MKRQLKLKLHNSGPFSASRKFIDAADFLKIKLVSIIRQAAHRKTFFEIQQSNKFSFDDFAK